MNMQSGPVSDTPQSIIRPYYAAFNGLRGMCVLMVFFAHFSAYWGDHVTNYVTWTGVDIFFVLSGFLITGILYDTVDEPRYFKNFYTRRALRIFPVYYGFFLLIFLLTPIFHLEYNRSILEWVFYVGNLTTPFTNLARHNPTVIQMHRHGSLRDVANLGALWSLCVEEQFYLVWPTVVFLIRDRRRLMNLCIGVSVGVLILRFVLELAAPPIMINQFLLYWTTIARCDTLLVGAWIALYLRGNAVSIRQIRKASSLLFVLPVLLLAAGYAAAWRRYDFFWSPFTMTIGFTLIALAAAGILLRCLDDKSRFSRFLTGKTISSLGVVSYGFYFYHGVLYHDWEDIHAHFPRLGIWIPLLGFASTWILCQLSFRFLESPFLKLKRVLAPQASIHKGQLRQHPHHLHVAEPPV
jgi:peptidoglycan/LPS O-acetylase OafA/YrhL